ncbi:MULTISPECIES: YcgL domain-containing protein [Modicisalibacter]|uniref:YcgL domain-containing protein n=1 Tax=Modicisalibacter TaxID=574347 RepID=UPI00100BE15C|nr:MULTISPECIES: YcgL domain-containing protein [Halomonadaceae]MBZ9560397.1 YcgL domain-containing protein [Modicisalibacter sp. R2A 31.J]MBZ9576306.1 YcgL domain-containing protein [Modicisalibacter sp. MOD 31.J]
MDKTLCEIFRSPRKEEMYLYVDKRRGLEPVPEELLERFGKPQPVMTLLLGTERKLARVDTARVIAAIAEKGYYLQLPPAKDAYLLDLYRTPTEGRY